jgi:hypothetical protein
MARAYSHHGHGPRADKTGRIHISDVRHPAYISLAKRSRSIHWVNSGPNRTRSGASAPPPITEVSSWNVCCQRLSGSRSGACSVPDVATTGHWRNLKRRRRWCVAMLALRAAHRVISRHSITCVCRSIRTGTCIGLVAQTADYFCSIPSRAHDQRFRPRENPNFDQGITLQ